MKAVLTKDMLDSIKRLNEECLSRVEFEHTLLDVIDKKEQLIETYKELIDEKDKRIGQLEEEFENLKEEACSFRKQIEKMFLKDREMFIWENGVLKVMDTSY